MRWAEHSRLSFRGFFVASVILCTAQVTLGQKPDDDDPGYRPQPSANVQSDVQALPIDAAPGSKVVVIAIDRTVELGLAAFVRREIETNPDAAAIVLDVNTLGGRVDAAIQIRDALLEAKPRTVAFIHPRAISAGALISLACDNVIMTEGGTIGAATPIQAGPGGQADAVGEKMVSYMRTEMRATAEANGRRGDIAEAMVDNEVVIEGIVDAGKLLTLDTDQAVKLGIADGKAANLDELMAMLSLEKPEIKTGELNWGEEIARWLTEPTISGLLLSVGMLGLMVAFYTRTVGAFTVIGFVSLAMFFGGHAVVHLVGWEEALLFLVGVALVVVEIFFVPGLGVPGVLGLVFVIAALVLALIGIPLDVSFETGVLADAMTRVLLSLLGAFVLALVVMRLFSRTAMGRSLVLADAETGFVSAPSASDLVGQTGEALTDLRPAGKVIIEGVRHEATSERAFVARGTKVRVIGKEGPELIVRPMEET
ncbi:MAG: ATP-dependent Clp protease proteolytic subunit [Deltaproteobacteria bacterium]|nr:ATP-dependent Clp protease proteolytic subunit [Deltaproteobacteria bacterium]NND28842.1 nodulation protein NfeD [Myxococcales bacterium]MBT8463498.1 ATP-dependent Clp protease proteolytic subunit [Deltaproteobacteria bacterium]MBT8482644.1 ATP-dependent Clp protease proteolytic subunit [Deltaproteobacteria bacterium]NNK06771.1 nodulation protein NfeD [Myxococcales bacterium]